MKIIFVSAYYPPDTMGGAEISTHLLAKGLLSQGHDIKVITASDKEEAVVFEGISLIKTNIPLRSKPLFEKKHSKRCGSILNKYKQYLREADIIHVHDFRSTLAVMEWKKKFGATIPVVATVRDYAQISGSTNFIDAEGELPVDSIDDASRSHRIKEAGKVRGFFRWWQYRYNINYRKKIFQKLDGQVFISKAQMELTLAHQELGKLKRTVIYNSIDDSYLNQSLKRGHDGLVLYVGRVERYKGLDLLLGVWRDVVNEVPHAHLKIVGEGADKKRYERIVEKKAMHYTVSILSSVKWNRMKQVYDEAQVVVAPHVWYEPFGRTVAEAMARGKVVVSADAGGPKELLEGSNAGILFKRNNKKGLTDALIKALTMDDFTRRDMGRKAYRWISQNLNKEAIADQYERFYMDITS